GNDREGSANAGSEQPAAEALVLRNGHDDLRLSGRLQEVLVAHDRGDDRRLIGVVGLESAQRRDGALEARVDGLQPKAGRALEDNGEEAFLDNVLGYEDLVDAVPVEIDGHWRGLDLVEGGPHHPVGDLTSLLLDGDGATAHRRPGTPQVLSFDRHLEAVEIIDEGQHARILGIDVCKRGGHGTEGLMHLYPRFRNELAVLPGQLIGLTLIEELLLAEALGPHRLLVPDPLDVHGEQELLDAVRQVARLAVLDSQDEGVQPTLGIVAIAHDLEDAV